MSCGQATVAFDSCVAVVEALYTSKLSAIGRNATKSAFSHTNLSG